MAPQHHLDGITAMRGVAIALVLAAHTMPTYFTGGFIGVDIFFVVSGFLITRMILRDWESGTFSLLNFTVRRAIRILPPLALTLALSVPAAWFIGLDWGISSKGLYSAMLLATNWARIIYHHPLSLFGHLWSIAIEEQFYLLYPGLLIVLLTWKNRQAAFWGVLTAFSLMYAARLYYALFDFDYWYLYHASHLRPTGLLIGSLAAFAGTKDVRWLRFAGSNAWGSVFLLLVVVAAFRPRDAFTYVAGIEIANLVAASTIMGFANHDCSASPLLKSAPMLFLGRISYSLYLVHLLIWYAFLHIKKEVLALDVFDYEILFAVLLLIPLMIAAAYVHYCIAERPFLELRRRLRSRSSWAVPATPVGPI